MSGFRPLILKTHRWWIDQGHISLWLIICEFLSLLVDNLGLHSWVCRHRGFTYLISVLRRLVSILWLSRHSHSVASPHGESIFMLDGSWLGSTVISHLLAKLVDLVIRLVKVVFGRSLGAWISWLCGRLLALRCLTVLDLQIIQRDPYILDWRLLALFWRQIWGLRGLHVNLKIQTGWLVLLAIWIFYWDTRSLREEILSCRIVLKLWVLNRSFHAIGIDCWGIFWILKSYRALLESEWLILNISEIYPLL